LSPGHFGKSLGNMGPLRIELARSVKGGGRLGKLPLGETRIAVRKSLER
jgi:hypothetical protein